MQNNRTKFYHDLNRRCTWFCLVILFLFFSACTPVATQHASIVQPQGNFSATGQEQLPEQWWLTFKDAELDRLITQALADNFTLQSAWDRLDRARAIARKAEADFFPHLSGEAGASSTKSRINSHTDSITSCSLGLAASYVVDLWGRIGSTSEAAELDALASAEYLQTAALTLSAQ